MSVYNETSLDGRIEGFRGDDGLYYRLGPLVPADAIVMGSRTALAFGPEESPAEQRTAGPDVPPAPVPAGFEDLVAGPRPLLVVVDGGGRVRCWRHAQAQPWYADHLCAVSRATPRSHVEHLHRRGVEVLEAGPGPVDLAEVLRLLRSGHGVERVRTDSGGALTGALLAADLVDEVVVLLRPVLAGRPDARGLVTLARPLPVPAGQDGVRLRPPDVEPVGDGCLLLRYEVVSAPW